MAWVLDNRRSRLLLQAVEVRTEHVFLEREAARALRRTPLRDDVPGVQAFPQLSAGGHRTRYPWNAWTDGRWWLYVADADYVIGREAFVAGLHGNAATRGATVTVHRARGCLAARFS